MADATLEPPSDCLACGTCCFSTLETSVRVTGDDYARLGDDAERYVHFVGNRAYMRLEGGRCAALRIEDGASTALPERGRFVCTVYEARPDACRELERGSPHCAGERFMKAGRAEAALLQIRSRA